MHSSQLESAIVNHNGDYSGDFIIHVLPIKGGDYKTITFNGNKFFRIAIDIIKNKKINYTKKLDITLRGKNVETDNVDNIKINSKDMVYLYLEKLRSDEISKIEQMEFGQLLRRYCK